jgi:hypothetical protein
VFDQRLVARLMMLAAIIAAVTIAVSARDAMRRDTHDGGSLTASRARESSFAIHHLASDFDSLLYAETSEGERTASVALYGTIIGRYMQLRKYVRHLRTSSAQAGCPFPLVRCGHRPSVLPDCAFPPRLAADIASAALFINPVRFLLGASSSTSRSTHGGGLRRALQKNFDA